MSEASRTATTSTTAPGSAPAGRATTGLAGNDVARPDNPARRMLLAGGAAAAALAAGIAAAASATTSGGLVQPISEQSGPDATLIAHCAAFDALEHRLQGAYSAAVTKADWEAADLIADAVQDGQAPILDLITACQLSTLAGCRAVAASLALWDDELMKAHPTRNYTDDRLLRVLVSGLIEQAPAADLVPDPDAGLLALCAEFQRVQALYADDGNPEWEAHGRAAHAAFVAVQGVAPATEAGHRAKGLVALTKLEENHGDGMAGDPYAEFALTMLRDWLRGTTG